MTEVSEADAADPAGSVDVARYLVVGGRRWRRKDPSLPEDVVAARLRCHLGGGRSAVGRLTRAGEDPASTGRQR